MRYSTLFCGMGSVCLIALTTVADEGGKTSESTLRATLTGHSKWVHSVTFSPDGELLVSAGGDGTVRIWSVAEAKHESTMRGHRVGVRSIAFSPDGKLLASKMWLKKEIATMKPEGGSIRSLFKL